MDFEPYFKVHNLVGNRNPEFRIQNPESTNQRKQVFQIREKFFCIAFACTKIRGQAKKPLKLTFLYKKINSSSVEIRAIVIPSEGYGYENLNKVRLS